MALELVTGPLVEPVSLAELKEFMRVDAGDTSQDNTISTLAVAAREFCEGFTGRRFVQQTWALYTDFFPGYIDLKLAGSNVSSPFVSGSNAVLVGIRYAIALPYPPVKSIASFTYQDANGNVTTMADGTDYVSDLISNPARLTPPFGQMWPVARVVVNAVKVEFVTGYAAPILISVGAGSATLSGYEFAATDVGCPVSIPGAGPSGAVLNTIIGSVATGVGTLRDKATTSVANGTSLLVNNGSPSHWERIRRAIKVMTFGSHERRLPAKKLEDSVEAILWPIRDKRL